MERIKRVGRFELLGELARGAMGRVYRARDPQLGREVALKTIQAKGNERHLPLLRKRFKREGKALAKLRHANIVRIHEVGQHKGSDLPYMVMDLVQGESLQRRIDRDGPLPPGEAATVARKIAAALHHAHTVSILHRDVKPANILLREDGEPLLIDFGLTKELDAADESGSKLTMQGRLVGTLGYAAPEQVLGDLRSVGPRSDVYGLGATLYAMLVGSPPCGTQDVMAMLEGKLKIPPPRSLRPEVDEALDAICMRCLEVDPRHRYADAQRVADDLGRQAFGLTAKAIRTSWAELLAQEPGEGRRDTPDLSSWTPPQPARPAWRVHAVWGGALVLALGGLALAWRSDRTTAARSRDRVQQELQSLRQRADRSRAQADALRTEQRESKREVELLKLELRSARTRAEALRARARGRRLPRDSSRHLYARWKDATALLYRVRECARLHRLALLALQRRDHAQAIRYLDAALVQDPTAFDARIDRVRVFLAQGANRKALRAAQDALDRRPGEPEALLLRGRAHAGLGERTKALADYDAAQARTRDADLRAELARRKKQLGKK